MFQAKFTEWVSASEWAAESCGQAAGLCPVGSFELFEANDYKEVLMFLAV